MFFHFFPLPPPRPNPPLFFSSSFFLLLYCCCLILRSKKKEKKERKKKLTAKAVEVNKIKCLQNQFLETKKSCSKPKIAGVFLLRKKKEFFFYPFQVSKPQCFFSYILLMILFIENIKKHSKTSKNSSFFFAVHIKSFINKINGNFLLFFYRIRNN